MRGQFPQAVVWDDDAAHHYALYIDYSREEVRVLCADCSTEFQMPLDRLESLKAIVLADTDCQIVVWIEVGHEQTGE